MDLVPLSPSSLARSLARSPLPAAALAAGLAACAPSAPDAPALGETAEEIIGGFPAKSARLDAIGALALRAGNGFVPFCSGTLISPTMVLTAEHCVDGLLGPGADPTPYAFLIGWDAFAPREVVPARGAAAEQTIEGGVVGYGADMAILHLAEAVKSTAPLPFAALTHAEIGARMAGVGYGVQNAARDYGTRMAGSMTLVATRGQVFAAMFGTFEQFLEEGAPRLFPELDPGDPAEVELLRIIYGETTLLEGIEAWFGAAPGDAQACFGDSGGPVIENLGGQPTVRGVASWVIAVEELCDLAGTAYASINPVTLDFIDYETRCPLIPRAGACEGLTVAVRCAGPDEGGRRVLRTDCGALGLICGTDASGALGCVEDPCEDLPPEGVCTGDVATRCTAPEEGPRRVVSVDCAAQGLGCVTDGGAATCVYTPGCGHDVCTTGEPLASTCDACTAAICAADAYCCSITWDSSCVAQVPTVCGTSCPAPADAVLTAGAPGPR